MSTNPLNPEIINGWADNQKGPVALHLRQELLPIEGKGAVIFPPTYANIESNAKSKYNIHKLSDGTEAATIDSVGAQANRIEPIFKEEPYSKLVPQIELKYSDEKNSEEKTLNILDVGHRLADAVVRCVNADENNGFNLPEKSREAFKTFLNKNDASEIAKIAPTSIVFGVWDSRVTQAKLPRIVQSVIRAWDISKLTRSAQYNPPLDYASLKVFSEEEREKAEGDQKNNLAVRGYVHQPAVETLGGIVVHGPIVRDLTINLIALRRLGSSSDKLALCRYILGLSLVAATAPFDPFLRQGCVLVPDPNNMGEWSLIERTGVRSPVMVDQNNALDYAKKAARKFGVGLSRKLKFDAALAREDSKKTKDKSTAKNKGSSK